jgi:hypothetical protein
LEKEANVSKEHIAFNFMVEEETKKKPEEQAVPFEIGGDVPPKRRVLSTLYGTVRSHHHGNLRLAIQLTSGG